MGAVTDKKSKMAACIFLLIAGITLALGNPLRTNSSRQIRKITSPYVESYWESWKSWEDFPNDYCADLSSVPASPIGSTSGVNLVNVAFADYSGGIHGTEAPEDLIRKGIQAIHQKGGFAKIALGGALYSMSNLLTEADAEAWAESMAATVKDLGLDGMDLDVEDSGTGANIQIALINAMRAELGPDFHISYTIPALSAQYEPWLSTIRGTLDVMDAVNIMAYDVYWAGYNFEMDLEMLEIMGVDRSKIVYGIMPGHHDAGNEYTSLEDAKNAALFVKENGLCGVMTWDLNRDAYQRMNYGPGDDNLYQTGQQNGAYIDMLSKTLNEDLPLEPPQ